MARDGKNCHFCGDCGLQKVFTEKNHYWKRRRCAEIRARKRKKRTAKAFWWRRRQNALSRTFSAFPAAAGMRVGGRIACRPISGAFCAVFGVVAAAAPKAVGGRICDSKPNPNPNEDSTKNKVASPQRTFYSGLHMHRRRFIGQMFFYFGKLFFCFY